MPEFPQLQSERLVLRAFTPDDALEVERLAGEREVAAGTLTMPHPYPEGAAAMWIATHAGTVEGGDGLTLAVERLADGALLGAMSLRIEREYERAELGYWIGRPYWGSGYATEAAAALVAYAFEQLELNRVYAYHFSTNPASGRVLQKIGMRHEGVRRQHHRKWGEFVDNDAYAILRSEWRA